jgi:general secretion pathway protein F
MPIYEYKGLSKKGKSVTGLVDADSPRELKERLKREGTFLTQYTETGRAGEKRTVGGEKAGSREVELSLFKRIKLIEVAEFTRQLATLVRAGIPVVDALSALSEQLENEKFKRVTSQVKRAVSEGASLGDALRAHPKVFPPLYSNMVGAGESSGNLEAVFARLADFMEGQVKLRSKLMGAMMYPLIMMGLGFIIVTMMMLFVVPMIKDIFDEMGKELPFITKVLIGTSDFFVDYWWLIFSVVIGGIVWFLRWRKSESGKPRWDRFTLKVPIFGPLIRMMSIARFTRTLATLLASGVPILSAMNIVRTIITNSVLANVVEDAREAVKEGQSIAEPLRRSKEFPSMVTHMIAVGEKSGELEAMLGNVADSYEVQVEGRVAALSSVLEPIMIVVMGAAIAFLVFAILMPMMQMGSLGRDGGV